MSKIPSIIKSVSDELRIESSFFDAAQFLLEVNFENKSHHFIANNLGLNDESVRKICTDKFYTYLLLQDDLVLPQTYSYIDPQVDWLEHSETSIDSQVAIVDLVTQRHSFPMMVKANELSRGKNVFKCSTRAEVVAAVQSVYDRNSKDYCHVLISQDYVSAKSEYRVIVYDGELMFAYLKDTSGADVQFAGNFSPLHWKNAQAILTTDSAVLQKIEAYIQPIFAKLNLKYGGLDIIIDELGNLTLIEINTQPGFTYFLQQNSDLELRKLFTKILTDLKKAAPRS